MRLRNHQRNEHYDHHHPRQAHHNSAEQPQTLEERTHDAHYASTKTTRNTRLSGYSAARKGASGWAVALRRGRSLTTLMAMRDNQHEARRADSALSPRVALPRFGSVWFGFRAGGLVMSPRYAMLAVLYPKGGPADA